MNSEGRRGMIGGREGTEVERDQEDPGRFA